MKRISDYSAYRAALDTITEDNVIDLYVNGVTDITIPEDVDPTEFAAEAVLLIEDLWGEPEVNFDYGPAEFTPTVEGNNLHITVS